MTQNKVDLFHSSSDPQLDLRLLFFGKEKCIPSHAWGPGLRDSYIIHYIHSGQGRFQIGDHHYDLQAGQGFMIPPGTLVHYQADGDDPWTYSWYGFAGVQTKSLMQRAGLSSRQPVFDIFAHGAPERRSESASFESFHHELVAAREEKSRDVLSLSILYRIMAELIRCSPDEHSTFAGPPASKDKYIRQAVEFIENQYSQRITVQHIAREVGLDRTYLSGLFKSRFGLSLQRFLLEYRMTRATELLRNKDLTVSDVSRSVGYTDPFLFSKMYKKTTGHSPTSMRDQSNSSGNSPGM
ncbi:AraC family transcriptional regulator [Paenibacillus lemnae]|uniref:AraC family transcriptional regulator n=1 Tax=Paenibacillus lemnae TaxID=1330551 RepID=A0A848M891_PAELE|nr:AraC family transcriptional regulator [Paenibacillus lemnae]NMO96431.1 AraC family transcriptional regulator [Paenibacillus lemnae]